LLFFALCILVLSLAYERLSDFLFEVWEGWVRGAENWKWRGDEERGEGAKGARGVFLFFCPGECMVEEWTETEGTDGRRGEGGMVQGSRRCMRIAEAGDVGTNRWGKGARKFIFSFVEGGNTGGQTCKTREGEGWRKEGNPARWPLSKQGSRTSRREMDLKQTREEEATLPNTITALGQIPVGTWGNSQTRKMYM
jgi:hypothetical protein